MSISIIMLLMICLFIGEGLIIALNDMWCFPCRLLVPTFGVIRNFFVKLNPDLSLRDSWDAVLTAGRSMSGMLSMMVTSIVFGVGVIFFRNSILIRKISEFLTLLIQAGEHSFLNKPLPSFMFWPGMFVLLIILSPLSFPFLIPAMFSTIKTLILRGVLCVDCAESAIKNINKYNSDQNTKSSGNKLPKTRDYFSTNGTCKSVRRSLIIPPATFLETAPDTCAVRILSEHVSNEGHTTDDAKQGKKEFDKCSVFNQECNYGYNSSKDKSYTNTTDRDYNLIDRIWMYFKWSNKSVACKTTAPRKDKNDIFYGTCYSSIANKLRKITGIIPCNQMSIFMKEGMDKNKKTEKCKESKKFKNDNNERCVNINASNQEEGRKKGLQSFYGLGTKHYHYILAILIIIIFLPFVTMRIYFEDRLLTWNFFFALIVICLTGITWVLEYLYSGVLVVLITISALSIK